MGHKHTQNTDNSNCFKLQLQPRLYTLYDVRQVSKISVSCVCMCVSLFQKPLMLNAVIHSLVKQDCKSKCIKGYKHCASDMNTVKALTPPCLSDSSSKTQSWREPDISESSKSLGARKKKAPSLSVGWDYKTCCSLGPNSIITDYGELLCVSCSDICLSSKCFSCSSSQLFEITTHTFGTVRCMHAKSRSKSPCMI